MTAGPEGLEVWRLGVHLAAGLLVAALLTAGVAEALADTRGDLQQGEALYRRYCAVCHGADGRGDGPNAPFLEEDRPRDLTDSRYLGGLSDEHLDRVIRDGGQAVRGSRFMPPWGRTLAPSQIQALIVYIRTLSARAPRISSPGAGLTTGDVLARELGCPACHSMGDLPPLAVAPDLSEEGNRVQRAWLIQFLRAPQPIRPVGYHPLSRSRMPDFRLSEEEAVSLAEYLMTQRNESQDGWFESTLGTELSGMGRDLFRQFACRACHSHQGTGGRAGPDLSSAVQRLKPTWVMRFVQDPQAVDPLTPMPHLNVGEDAARAITSYLFSAALPPPEPPPNAEAATKGLALFTTLGCSGCHRGARDQLPSRVGPDLSAVGDKLKPVWLSDFLVRPSAIRPGLNARMPTFRLNDRETQALVGFLASLRDGAAATLAARLRFQGTISEASVQAGRRLVSREFLSCSSCHAGEEPPQGPPEEWAPDLRLSAQRLNPEWILRWLRGPQQLAPGTKMPSFFLDETSGPEEILEGDEESQIQAIRDYILSLSIPGTREPR